MNCLSNAWSTTKVLMWKHYVVRKRRYIQTIIELFSPLLFYVLLFIMREELSALDKEETQGDQRSHSEPYTLDKPISRLLYTPDTPITKNIMREAAFSVELTKRYGMPNHDDLGYWGVNSSAVLDTFAKDMRDDEAIIIFQNLSPDEVRLMYTIRMKIDYGRDMKISHYLRSPGLKSRDDYKVFMKIQRAIDMAYLKILTGYKDKTNITFEEIRSERKTEYNTAILVLSVLITLSTGIALLLPFVFIFSRLLSERASGMQNITFEEIRSERKTEYNTAILVLSVLITLSTGIALLLPFVFIFSRLLSERASGMQELMKMNGVPSAVYLMTHFLNSLPAALLFGIVVAILMKISDTAIIPETNITFIFLAFLLHYCTIVTLAMACSYILRTMNFSGSIACLIYVFFWSTMFIKTSEANDKFMDALPHKPQGLFMLEISMAEFAKKGVDTSTKHSVTVMYIYLMMVLQCIFFFMLAWYLDKVRPGQYGVALPWNFLCQLHYWFPKKEESKPVKETGETKQKVEEKYFEKQPNLSVGIKILNVTKVFRAWKKPDFTVLSRFSLDIYKGEITVLLGHNGAGKTTLISIITGMIRATSGTVYVNGVDNVKHRGRMLRDIGLCPQHNMFFPDVTVREHIIFFAMVKGLSYKESKLAADNLVSEMHLQGKENSNSTELSGGMQRRLQLACALAGDGSVLVLDEPTSGLDVETRRQLWNMLLSKRTNRTVLLTTHFMEEADALADRVAALHNGVLVGQGTPMFLKRVVGSGYKLYLTIDDKAVKKDKSHDITKAIQGVIPHATMYGIMSNSVTYVLPAEASYDFPKLFDVLEKKTASLGIVTMGVGVTTLDDVFIKLCSDGEVPDQDGSDENIAEQDSEKITGFPLHKRIAATLLKRQLKATWSVKWQFLIIQLLIPILLICVLIRYFELEDQKSAKALRSRYFKDVPPEVPPAMMSLELFRNARTNRAVMNMQRNSYKSFRTMTAYFPDVDFVQDYENGYKDILRERKALYKNRYLVGVQVTESHSNILYKSIPPYTASVALNVLSNVIASQVLPWQTEGRSISTFNSPIPITERDSKPRDFTEGYAVVAIVIFVMLAVTVNEVALPCKEREHGSRHFQIMSGCPPALYWLITWLYDGLTFIFVLVIPAVVAFALLDQNKTFDKSDFLVFIFFMFVLGGFTFLVFVYVVSFIAGKVASIVLLVITFVFGLVLPLTLANLKKNANFLWHLGGTVSKVLIPCTAFGVGALRMCDVAILNANCHYHKKKCPKIQFTDEKFDKFDANKCCASKTASWGPFSYLAFESGGAEVMYLFLQTFAYGALLILFENGTIRNLKEKLHKYVPPEHKYQDQMVKDEAEYVNENIRSPPPEITKMTHNLHKKHSPCFRAPVYAVKGINFSVRKGECFGLLGMNGAGKSTTFKMITAEEAMTRGHLYADKYYLNNQRSKYLYAFGYCPQFGGFDDFLTGADNVRQLLAIRGFHSKDIETKTETWIKCVGLEKHTNRISGGYSGGCMRRLAAAISLSSGAPVSLLDEPTSGVDIIARRRVWTALKRGLRDDRSIIITSHSMDEMESLCDRLAIMCAGEICALGAPAALRAQHSDGKALRIKIHRQGEDESQSRASTNQTDPAVDDLKKAINDNFQASYLLDEYQTMLHYRLVDDIPYSHLFKTMEKLKQDYPDVLEDYSVSETTLEEVFLSFAKKSTE